MSEQSSRNDWMIRQFNAQGLKPSYRNAILHASIIEGAVRKVIDWGSFHQANKTLRYAKKIERDEFQAFEKVRTGRNKLLHESFKRDPNQNDIENLVFALMKEIHNAYKISRFLDDKVFKKYEIKRLPRIELE